MNKTKLTAAIVLLVAAIASWQIFEFNIANKIVDGLIQASSSCIAGNESICSAIPPTKRNLDSQLSKLLSPLAEKVGDDGRYTQMQTLLAQSASQAQEARRKEDAKMNAQMEEIRQIKDDLDQAARRSTQNQAERAKEFEKFSEEYETLAPPKILYSCDGKVSFRASRGISNFNDLYMKAKSECPENWEFKVIKSSK
ncbi:MAG: hypothetical protein RBS40_16280 [Rhodocyclaceae bacterium]|nr:hypothetical protein [Rhodocyclaceae bacterium]